MCFTSGTRNFNARKGCQRCNVAGVSIERVMTFALQGKKRTDHSFRTKKDPDHHATTTPIERLRNFNMITGFVAADELHLRDLGICKSMLTRFINPPTKKFTKTKFSHKMKNDISNFLETSNKYMPAEMHRRVRGLDAYRFWKGAEFRQFFFYLGPIILKDYLPSDFYQHFLMLHAAFKITAAKRCVYLLYKSQFFCNILAITIQYFFTGTSNGCQSPKTFSENVCNYLKFFMVPPHVR